eukprot:4644959-Prymnesium_polylepis.1
MLVAGGRANSPGHTGHTKQKDLLSPGHGPGTCRTCTGNPPRAPHLPSTHSLSACLLMALHITAPVCTTPHICDPIHPTEHG